MLPLRFAAGWRTASLILLILVLVAMLIPAGWFVPEKQKLASWFGEADKWLHGLTFLVLALWFAGQYGTDSYWRIAIGLLAFGGLIEVTQNMVEYRSGEWFDMLANVVGIGAGLAIALLGPGGWCLWVEQRFVPAEVEPGGD